MSPAKDEFKLPPELELERIVSLQTAEKVSGLSADSWKRHHSDKIIEMSPRRRGVRLRHALMLRRKDAQGSSQRT
jgi:hypothetical protein